MELILWRHAEAEDGIPDSERRLTDKGQKQAKTMAAWLKPRLPKNTRILVSPTMRTRQTAAALDDAFEISEEIGPGVSVKAILTAAGWPNGDGAVVVVGHQPTLGETAAWILSAKTPSWNIRKGAAWWFTHKMKNGAGEIFLHAAMSPDMA